MVNDTPHLHLEETRQKDSDVENMLNNGLAKEIAEDLLYRTGVALAQDDADAFVSCFFFPQMIETANGARVVESPDELKQIFFKVRDHHRSTGITNLVRAIVSAEFSEADVIYSTHVSHHLDISGIPAGKPYPALSVLRQKDGEWKIEASIYALLDDPSMNEALELRGTENSDA